MSPILRIGKINKKFLDKNVSVIAESDVNEIKKIEEDYYGKQM